MRFHLVSLPHTQTTSEFCACAFTEKVRKFSIMMMSLGHAVYLYSGDKNEAPCTEHITCMSEAERLALCGGQHYSAAPFDGSNPYWRAFNLRAVEAIKQRAHPRDFICVIGGHANKAIADALPEMMTVEFGIGYGGTFSQYRVFESYAWMHACYGAAHNSPNDIDGKYFDAVIPGYFEVEKFAVAKKRKDYFLYIGRVTDRKGVKIAADTCRHIGARLIIAGTGADYPDYGERVGHVGEAERNYLMAHARAVFVPTIYVEPFGNVAVEAQACGTPVISTDWGAMTETVAHGVTGFRCRTLKEFVQATSKVANLDPAKIRRHAVNNYSLPVIARQYDTHFRRLLQLWGQGWYEMGEIDG
jgi:glycosyltransferase involved in cell wall biosynthesis